MSHIVLKVIVFPAKSVKDLGVILDKHLSYDENISKIVSSCNLKLKQISRVKYLFDEKTLILIIQKRRNCLIIVSVYVREIRPLLCRSLQSKII